jgi:predicted secreted Zn-dependent protease
MFNVKHAGTTNKTYTVKGDTLADIWKSIEKNGPTVDGKKVAGLTTCPVEVNASSVKFDQTFKAGKKGGFDAELFHKAGTLSYKCTILMPKLASDKKLSKAAKAEWKQFMGKLAKHEDGHVIATGKEAKVIGAELDAVKYNGSGKDKNAAFKDAIKTYKKEFIAKYGGTKVSDRLKKIHKDFHAKSGHGPALNRTIK